MFSRMKRTTLWQWTNASTAAIVVLGLSGIANGQENRTNPADQDRDSIQSRKLSHNSDDFSMAPRWEKSSVLRDKKVTNSANENLGKLEDIVVDADSGRILYGVLSFGGFLGVGDKLFAIPWQSLRLSGDNKAITLDVDKDRLKNAPGFDKKHWPNFADEQWATSTYEYYNQKPYWLSRSEDSASTNYRDRWNQRVTSWQKCSDLCGKGVVDARNESTGKVSDLVIDPDGGRILYGVVNFRDKFFAVPWSALTLPKDARQLALNVNNDQLKDSISFGKDNWPNITDETWARDTFAYYKIQPYWNKAEARVQR